MSNGKIYKFVKKALLLIALVILHLTFNIEHCLCQTWSPLGTGMNNYINALTVYNNELIAGGSFQTAGGVSADRIAKWNGTSWSPLGSGVNATVYSLAVYNNELIAGGLFSAPGNNIAKWNGTSWSPLGNGMNSLVLALTVYNNELIAGGQFTTAGGVGINYIAKWGNPTGVININTETPKEFSLSQNYPNPFNPETNIKFEIPENSFVTLKVYDALGREVETLVNETKPAGSYSVDFNASGLSGGVYFCKITAGGFTDTKRMVLIK